MGQSFHRNIIETMPIDLSTGSSTGVSRLCQADCINDYSSLQTTFSMPAHVRALLAHERMDQQCCFSDWDFLMEKPFIY